MPRKRVTGEGRGPPGERGSAALSVFWLCPWSTSEEWLRAPSLLGTEGLQRSLVQQRGAVLRPARGSRKAPLEVSRWWLPSAGPVEFIRGPDTAHGPPKKK